MVSGIELVNCTVVSGAKPVPVMKTALAPSGCRSHAGNVCGLQEYAVIEALCAGGSPLNACMSTSLRDCPNAGHEPPSAMILSLPLTSSCSARLLAGSVQCVGMGVPTRNAF